MNTICMFCLAIAIAEIETGNDPMAVGQHGERTRFQFLPSVWQQYSDVPMEEAQEKEIQRVFQEHVKWIIISLEQMQKAVTVKNVFIIWNAGYGNFSKDTVPESSIDYAKRAFALYNVCRKLLEKDTDCPE